MPNYKATVPREDYKITTTKTDELDFEGKTILIEYFATDIKLMAKLKADGEQPENDVLAYCETYSDDKPSVWGKLYFLNDVTPSVVAHESVHLASGILARKWGKPKGLDLRLTTELATDTEEELASIVEGVTELLTNHLFVYQTNLINDLIGRLPERREHLKECRVYKNDKNQLLCSCHTYAHNTLLAEITKILEDKRQEL